MAIMFPRGPPTYSFFKLFTLCLPFFCLLLTWASSTTTPPPPPPSAVSILHSSGYSLFASTLMAAIASNSFNATGTILAPPDFAFSFAIAKFNHQRRRPPPHPSTSLLLYHTIEQPLTWKDLYSRANGDEHRTLYDRHCVFVSKTANGDLSFAGSRKSIATVKIRHPDLYVDDHLTVHGVDGVLDPSSASKCSVPHPTVEMKLQMDRTLLDFTIRALKRKGFSVVAIAMTLKCFDLLNLNGVTVFAPSDAMLFSFPDGFRYDFRHHVVPSRLRFADIARLPAETAIETIDPYKTLVIGSVNGNVTVNGVMIDNAEVYVNRWMVVISISRTFDDGGDTNQIQNPGSYGVPSTAPIYSTTGLEDYGVAVPSTAPSYSGDAGVSSPTTELPAIEGLSANETRYSGESSVETVQAGVPSAATNFSGETENATGRSSLADCSPAVKDGVDPGLAVEVEGGDVVCPGTAPPRSNESEALINVDAAPISAVTWNGNRSD